MRSLTTWSVVAMVAAFALAWIERWGVRTGGPWLSRIVAPIGEWWLTALQLAVLPLVVTQMLAAITQGRESGRRVWVLGLRTLTLFLAMLVLAGIATVLVMGAVLPAYHVAPSAVAAIRQAAPAGARASSSRLAQGWSAALTRWLGAGTSGGRVLPVLVVTILVGVATGWLPDAPRRRVTDLCGRLAAGMVGVIRIVLIGTPIGVFSLIYPMARTTGLEVAGVIGTYVLTVSAVSTGMAAALYPIAALAGRISLRAFARAAAPPQLVAVSTRSSIASLPALVESARDRLGLPVAATGFVLPLSVSIFKINRTVSATVKLLFLAHLYGLSLSPPTVAGFLASTLLVSFGTAGVPTGMSFGNLPLYLAAGIPAEGAVLLEATNVVPDIFNTVLNVTADLCAAVLLTRGDRRRKPAVVVASRPATVSEELS